MEFNDTLTLENYGDEDLLVMCVLSTFKRFSCTLAVQPLNQITSAFQFHDVLCFQTIAFLARQEMPWVLDVIDHNKTFEEDPFYTAQVLGSIPSAFQSTFVDSFDLASFNGSDACPGGKRIGKETNT